jgi:hypothetical protein
VKKVCSAYKKTKIKAVKSIITVFDCVTNYSAKGKIKTLNRNKELNRVMLAKVLT